MASGVCKIDGCGRPANIDGLCFSHYEAIEMKKTYDINLQILNILKSIENKLNNLSIPVVTQPDMNDSSKVSSTSNVFIPTVLIPENISNSGYTGTVTSTNTDTLQILEIANQLKNTIDGE